MQIKLINCRDRLLALGIDMNAIGSYDTLCTVIKQRLTFIGLEYDFPPLDYMLIDVEDGTNIPDLSDFGEVVLNDSPIG